MAEKISLDEVVPTERIGRGEGKYERWFKANASDILNLDDKSGIRLKPEELDAENITTVQYNLMKLFYAAELPYVTQTYTKDGVTYIVIKKSGDKFDESKYGSSHKKATSALRVRMKEWLAEHVEAEGTA